ncbi:unnamed protein product [Tetraodon nigroviridis]|nr:unnamed protein product [Tetraodon nigroviridis]
MGCLFRALIFLAVVIAAVQCLTCKLCALEFSGTCLIGGNITCDNQTSSCFSGTVMLNASKTVTVKNAGCVPKSFCGTKTSGSLLNIDYVASFDCCNTDLCNHASSLQLPLIVALCFGAVTSVWLML